MEMEAPLPDFISDLHIDILLLINDFIPCLVRRRRMARACRSFRNAVRPENRPAQPDLPFVLLPRAAGPSFSCVLRGCDTHHLDVPVDARAARCFGAYEGGWVFLAVGQADGHTLLNLRTHQRFDLPDFVRLGGLLDFDMNTIVVAAALSSPPEQEQCVAAAICCAGPVELIAGPCVRAFWLLERPVPANNGTTGALTEPNLEDVMHHNGAFYFLTDAEDLLVFEPVINNEGELDIQAMRTRYFRFPQRRCHYDGQAHVRYLVESREELLMVVRLVRREISRTTSAFRVFQMVKADPAGENTIAECTWNELDALGGRMLFVGRGCSRSYEVANYPGFNGGVYFLDDGRFYGDWRAFEQGAARWYPCRGIGKWSSSEPIPRMDNFLPEQAPSIYSPPAWFLS